MKNNRAGWLALGVLAIATLLMVFFVLPRVTGDKQPIGDVVNKASDTIKDAVSKPDENTTKPAAEVVDATVVVTEKMGRLAASAGAAVGELKGLFANNATPDATALTSAKTKAASSISEIANINLPDTVDAAAKAGFVLLRDGARKALALLQALPDDPAAALRSIAQIEAALGGKPDLTTADATPDAAPASDQPPLPAFDVLRVEPDGSTVIAGKAEPGAKLDIVDGETVISSVDVGPSGDFAAVLDNPLPAGDHQLQLKVTGKDGKSVLSEEVATVSVPKDESGDLLAMVSKPGKASRIIAAPVDKSAPAGDAPADVAAADPAPTPNDQPAATTDGTGTPDLPAGSAALSGSAPTMAAPTDTTTPAPAAGDTAAPEIQVTAVEIEADKIFVAGIARPKISVAAYADESLIGKTAADAEGRFVVEGRLALAVGDHTIRVDAVDAAGKVLVRAAVPFNRPAGQQVAVVAQGDTAAAGPAATNIGDGSFDRLRGDVGRAFTLLRNLFAGGKQPNAEQLAAGRSATEFSLKSLSEFRPTPDVDQAAKDLTLKTADSATKTLAFVQALPKDAKSVGAALEKIAAMIDEMLRVPASADTVADDAAPAPAETTTTAAGSEPKTIAQAPLTESKHSVIIRRGDTLWQISRRVYGMGIRYTTIYVANRDQILNPDRIRPGQIFGLPKDALPDAEGEGMHRKRLNGTAVN